MKHLFIFVGGLVIAVAGLMLVSALVALAQLLPHAVREGIATATLVCTLAFMPAVCVIYGVVYLVRSRQ